MRHKKVVSQRGQSLLELALTLPLVLLLLAGLVEIGFFINEYIDVIDATREAARFGTSLVYTEGWTYDNPADDCDPGDLACIALDQDRGYCTTSADGTPTTHFYYVVSCLARDNLKRVEGLAMDLGKVEDGTAAFKGQNCDNCRDDIVISVFSFDRCTGGGSCQPVKRFPDADGWSFTREPSGDGQPGCRALDIDNSGTIDSADYCPSTISASDVGAKLVSGAPNAGLVLVEVFYHHYQVLNLPFFNLIANPLRVHAYSFFPNPSAEPTATE
jgi:hypothetical protein